MKILYVKNNSERVKKYQLATIIYEKDGEKFVKKQALCEEAIPHLKRMKENYHTLTSAIINPKIKLSKIIDEDSHSLTFEFIEGISLEKKINDALHNNTSIVDEMIENYLHFLETSFKTTEVVKNSHSKDILLNVNFTQADHLTYFKDISNIDLIFSNIIYKDDAIYLIDYEWIFALDLPINYALYRSLRAINTHIDIQIESYISDTELTLFNTMEKNFFDNEVVSEKSFFKVQNNYHQNRVNNYAQLETFRNQINHLQNRVVELETQLQNSQSEVISYASSKSWQITRPLRTILNYFKGHK